MSNSEIPKWNELLGKTMLSYKDGDVYAIRDTKITVADELGLNEELRKETTLKVSANKIEGRIGWAIYIGLGKAKLIEEVAKGQYKITERGE
jgi:restriction endonuclease Mrr